MPSQAVDLAKGDLFGDAYDLRGYFRLEEDGRLAGQASDGATTEASELRRLRLGLGLRWDSDWLVHVAGNFAHRASLRDLWLEYRGWPVRVDVGRFPEPFGLGESIGSADSMLSGLPSPSALGPHYGFGIGFNYRGTDWGLAGGAFTGSAGPTLSGKYGEDALTGRATWRPLVGEDSYLHLGVSGSIRRTQPGTGVQLFGSAESPLLRGMTAQSSLQAQTDSYRLLGAESLVRVGSVILLGETIQAQIADGGPRWHGEDAEVAWCLTGEKRSYSTRYGTIGGISPNRPVDLGGAGAWEVALRWSRTELADGGGDRVQARSAALNWYPIDALRVSVLLLRAHLDPAGLDPREARLAQLQLQLGW